MNKKRTRDAWQVANIRFIILTVLILAAAVTWMTFYAVQPVELHPVENGDNFHENSISEQYNQPVLTDETIREHIPNESGKDSGRTRLSLSRYGINTWWGDIYSAEISARSEDSDPVSSAPVPQFLYSE